ncbi:hypothetical protein Tco_0200375 [Tanacetum coccineum]
MISVNNLKTDSENDYEKVMPSIPSPEPAVSCFDDLDFFKDFENEFPAIVYNDAQTSKSDLLTEPILNPQRINEFDLSDETSLSEYDEEEQNIWLFHHVSRDIDFRYEGLEYTDSDIEDFESRLERIYTREIHKGWRRLFDTRGPLVWELILEFLSTLRFGEVLLDLDAPGLHTGEEIESPDFAMYWSERPPPSYTLIRDLVLRLCHRMMAHSIVGRSQEPKKAWVAMGVERKPDAAAGAPAVAEDAPAIDEGRMMDRAGVTYTPYSQTHMSYQRCVRQRTGEASTSAAQQDPQQPDP